MVLTNTLAYSLSKCFISIKEVHDALEWLGKNLSPAVPGLIPVQLFHKR